MAVTLLVSNTSDSPVTYQIQNDGRIEQKATLPANTAGQEISFTPAGDGVVGVEIG